MGKWPLPALALVALVAAACATSYARPDAEQAVQPAKRCPAAWVAGYRALARRVHAPVYCPTWLPQPLSGEIGSEFAPQAYVNRDRSYLVSFLWFEKAPSAPYEVHVNLRGYPGRTAVPMCPDTLTAAGKTVHPNVPCFADPHGQVRVAGRTATVYTANQGIDNWHVVYAWHYHGSLYAISQHVAPPFTFDKVLANLDRMLRGLVLVKP